MAEVDQCHLLEAFSRDYSRELRDVLAADLGRSPQLVFQQLYNRLRWHVDGNKAGANEEVTGGGFASELLAGLLQPAFVRCSAGAAPLWLHVLARLRESEAVVRTFVGHAGSVHACVFSPDGGTIVSVSGDMTLRLWDARTGAEGPRFPALGGLAACPFSPLGHLVCCGATGGTVYILGLVGAMREQTSKRHLKRGFLGRLLRRDH